MTFEQKKRLLKEFRATENRLLELADRKGRWQQMKNMVAHPSALSAIDGVVDDFDRRITSLAALREIIEEAILQLNDGVMQDLLVLRYIEGADWDSVADCLGYSRRQVFNLHNLAVEKLPLADDCTNCTF